MKCILLFLILLNTFDLFAQDTSSKDTLPITQTRSALLDAKVLSAKFSLNNADKTPPKYSFLNITGQVVVGSASAVLLSLPAAAKFSFGGGNNPSDGAQAVFVYSLYIIGTAAGVDLIGSIENESLSFWGLLTSSAIGGAAGFLAYSSVKNEFYFPILAGPLVGALIYSLFISD